MALASKKTPRKFIKGRSDGLITTSKIEVASASMASDIFSEDPIYSDSNLTPILYHTDLIQEDVDELRRYVVNDISSGGGLTNTPLANASGRFHWSSSDDGERVHLGSTSYGPFNWYNHNGEPSYTSLKTYSAGTVDSTLASVLDYHPQAYGIYVPDENKKVKARINFRVQNGNTFDFGFSMWDCPPPSNGSTSVNNITLRAQSATTTANSDSTKNYTTEFTTTSAVSDKYLFFLAEHRAGSLTTNTYIYFNLSLFLVD